MRVQRLKDQLHIARCALGLGLIVGFCFPSAADELIRSATVANADWDSLFDSMQIGNRGRTITGFYTVQYSIKEGRCVDVVVLSNFGGIQAAHKAFRKFLRGANCSASHDGSLRGVETTYLLDYSDSRYKKTAGRVSKETLELISPSTYLPSQQLREAVATCEGRCLGDRLLGLMFALANAFDREQQESTAALWRTRALGNLWQHPKLIDKARADLKYHASSLFKYAGATGDPILARRTRNLAKMIDTDLEARMDSLLREWESALDLQSKPLVRKVTLKQPGPLSDFEASSEILISSQTISLDLKGGSLSHTSLRCSPSTSSFFSTQVQLHLDQSGEWTLPESWENCRLVFLGSEGTEVIVIQQSVSTLGANQIL